MAATVAVLSHLATGVAATLLLLGVAAALYAGITLGMQKRDDDWSM